MGELADRLDALVVTVRSPDRQIAAIVRRQGTSIDLRFEPRKYRVYDEDELARQLARLATSAWVRFKRDYDETVRTHWPGVLAPSDDGIDFGPERRAYRLRLEVLTALGASPDRRIRVGTRALVRWRVKIAAGTIRRFTEEQFLAAAHAALDSLLADYRAKVNALKEEIYGPQIPADGRSRL